MQKPDRPTIVVTHAIFDETVAILKEEFNLVLNPTRETLPRKEIIKRSRGADGIIAFMPDYIDEHFLNECPKLKVIACALKGYDNFDIEACTRRGIWLTVVPDLLTTPTAELAVGLALALGRNIPAGDAWVRSRKFRGWLPRFYGKGLSESTVGIVGMGRVGRAVAEILSSFKSTVLYFDPSPLSSAEEKQCAAEYAGFDKLLTMSDFIMLAVPLTAETRYLIDREALSLMRRETYLINICRGSVVDEFSVADSLERGELAGYAADVFAFEDWVLRDRPREIPERLLNMQDKTLFTPHIGSAVTDARKAIEAAAAQNIRAVFCGEHPPDEINMPLQMAKEA